MASIISAGTTSATALNMSADTSGVLQLASNNGTVAVTVNGSQQVGVGTASPANLFHVSTSTASNSKFEQTGTGANYLTLRSNGSDRAFIGLENSSGTGLFGGGTAYGLSIGTTAASAIALATNNTVRVTIDSSGRVITPSQPAFYATGIPVSSQSSGVVLFGSNSIPINVGSSYSQSTGRFTAPIAGNYLFCTVGMAQSQWFRAQLRKNGSPYTEYRTSDSTSSANYPQSSLTVIVPLAANDYVDISVTAGNFGGSWDEVQFGGYLLG